jgi:hypothetical protein
MQASKARTSFDPFYPIAWNKPTRTSKEEVKYWNYLVVQSILQLNEKALDSDRRTISINSLVVEPVHGWESEAVDESKGTAPKAMK